MMTILDFHTHRTDANQALISVSPKDFSPQPGRYYSVGYHPWLPLETLSEDDFALLEQCARHPQVLAIGETGMDSLRGNDLVTQEMVFVRHLRLAGDLHKPVVVHSVRTAQQILAARRREGLTQVPLIVHGMRGNERVARTWLEAGCYLSYGVRFNPKAVEATPRDRLLIETDEAHETIQEVAAMVADALKCSADDIMALSATNARHLLAAGQIIDDQ